MTWRKTREAPDYSVSNGGCLDLLGDIVGHGVVAILCLIVLAAGLVVVEWRSHKQEIMVIGVTVAVLLILVVAVPPLIRRLAERTSRADRRRWKLAERVRRAERRRRSAWKDAAKQLQRTLHQESRPGESVPTVSIEPEDRDVRVVLEAHRAIAGLALSRGARAGRVPTGDPEFDDRVSAAGEEAVVLAVLDGQARAKVAHLLTAWDAEVRAGRLVVRAALGLADTPRRLQDLLAAVRDAADALRLDARGVPERLARNAGEDPAPEVRLRNLAVLQAAFPSTAAAREASRAALTAPEPAMRMTAAAFLGREASATLRTLAESDSPAVHIRLAAAIQYVLTVPVAEAVAFLVQFEPELGRLATWAGVTGADSTLFGTAVERLASLDDAGREPVVIALLARAPGPVKLAAVRALGRMGSVAAVEPLLSCIGSSAWGAELAEVARTAVAAIQARLGDVEAGRLSVATPAAAAGGLTAAEPDPTGALSPTQEPRTSPSTTPEVRPPNGLPHCGSSAP